jgi:hypothetical protein
MLGSKFSGTVLILMALTTGDYNNWNVGPSSTLNKCLENVEASRGWKVEIKQDNICAWNPVDTMQGFIAGSNHFKVSRYARLL